MKIDKYQGWINKNGDGDINEHQIKINNVKNFNVELTESEIDFLLMGLQQAILYEDDSVDVILRLCDLFKRLQKIKDSESF